MVERDLSLFAVARARRWFLPELGVWDLDFPGKLRPSDTSKKVEKTVASL
jgi:hypothetical protein